MDEIHDQIQQFSAAEPGVVTFDDIVKVLNIMDKMNEKINAVSASTNRAASTASMLANGIQPD